MCKTSPKGEGDQRFMTDKSDQSAIECRHLWKIFGDRASEALAAAKAGDVGKDEALERFGCVIGVADASFSVKQGEIFCIMGLSGFGQIDDYSSRQPADRTDRGRGLCGRPRHHGAGSG